MRQFLIAATFVSVLPHALADDGAPRRAQSRQNRGAEPLTVMTWNLEWFFDNEAGDNYSDLAKAKTSPSRRQWDWKRDAVAQSIADSKPSILALQEVENRRVLWYLTRAMNRNHKLEYHELGIESRDHFTEQDVGFLFRPPVDALTVMQGMYPKRLRSTNQYFDLSKHIRGVFEFQSGETTETVTVLNIHFRAKPEAADKRIRQARLLHHWIASAIERGQNVIVLGDFNTEFRGSQIEKESDIGIACGLETADTDDDLIEDDPTRPNLVFSKIEILRDLAIRGDRDTAEQHWDSFWKIPEHERDLSDHYPVMATFEIR